MSLEEYFGGWLKVIDRRELDKVLGQINSIKRELLCPSYQDIFKAFHLCPYETLKIMMIGYDPYPQRGVATGILFGNRDSSIKSPSLEVIQDACIDYSVPHNPIVFDPTLESWAVQGMLLINSSLTCEIGKTGSHTMLWRPFMTTLLRNLSIRESGIVYVLFGEQARTLKPYISKKYNIILEEKHPSWYARTNTRMPSRVFREIEKIIEENHSITIKWFEEESFDYGEQEDNECYP